MLWGPNGPQKPVLGLRMLLMISLWWVYFLIMWCYNEEFIINMITEISFFTGKDCLWGARIFGVVKGGIIFFHWVKGGIPEFVKGQRKGPIFFQKFSPCLRSNLSLDIPQKCFAPSAQLFLYHTWCNKHIISLVTLHIYLNPSHT